MTIVAKKTNPAEVDIPSTNKVALYVDCCDGKTKIMDDAGCICNVACSNEIPTVPADNTSFTNGCGYIKGFGEFVSKTNGFCADKGGIVVLTVNGQNTGYSCPISWICDITGGMKFGQYAADAFRGLHSVYAPAIIGHCYSYGVQDLASRGEYSVSFFGMYPFSC